MVPVPPAVDIVAGPIRETNRPGAGIPGMVHDDVRERAATRVTAFAAV